MAQKPSAKSRELDQIEALKALAEAVGDFIRYWGFRRIHGQLWTQIYLSDKPLSGADLMRNLDVSKALVSPALSELQQFNLIECLEVDGRTKTYKANPEVFKVIRSILKEREKKMIRDARERFEDLSRSLAREPESLVNSDRMKALGEMISAADFAIDFIIQSSDAESLSSWVLLGETFQNSKS